MASFEQLHDQTLVHICKELVVAEMPRLLLGKVMECEDERRPGTMAQAKYVEVIIRVPISKQHADGIGIVHPIQSSVTTGQ